MIDSGRRSRQEEDSRASKKRDGMETAVTDGSAVTDGTTDKKRTKDAPRLKEDRNKDRDVPTDIMTVTTDTDSIAEADTEMLWRYIVEDMMTTEADKSPQMTRLRERARHVWVYIYGDTEIRRRYRGDKKYKEAVKEYKERIDSGRRSRQEEDSRVSKKRDGKESCRAPRVNSRLDKGPGRGHGPGY